MITTITTVMITIMKRNDKSIIIINMKIIIEYKLLAKFPTLPVEFKKNLNFEKNPFLIFFSLCYMCFLKKCKKCQPIRPSR